MRVKSTIRGLLVALAVLFSLSLFAGCPPKNPTEDTSGPAQVPKKAKKAETKAKAPAGEPIKIGAIFDVTGSNAPLGEPEKKTAEMLADEINGKGGVLGRPVQVIVEDTKTDPTEANLRAKDLIETQKVCAIIGTSGTPTTLAITDTCEKAKIPLVSCAAGKPITDPIKSFVFAVPQTDALAVAKIIVYLQSKKIAKVATIYVANPFGESGQKQLIAQLAAAKIEVVDSESFATEDTDMTAQLTKIKSKNPEAVICWGTNPGPAHVTKGMKKLGITVPLIQSHGVANKKFLDLAGDAAEGVQLPAGRLLVWQSVPDSNPQKAVLKDFAEAYKAKYQEDANTFAGHAYDSLNIVVNAIKAANSTDSAKIRDEIEKTSKFVGTAGVFNYSATDHNGLTKDAFVWVQISKGAWKLAE